MLGEREDRLRVRGGFMVDEGNGGVERMRIGSRNMALAYAHRSPSIYGGKGFSACLWIRLCVPTKRSNVIPSLKEKVLVDHRSCWRRCTSACMAGGFGATVSHDQCISSHPSCGRIFRASDPKRPPPRHHLNLGMSFPDLI